jgi:hypothetical protein
MQVGRVEIGMFVDGKVLLQSPNPSFFRHCAQLQVSTMCIINVPFTSTVQSFNKIRNVINQLT